MNVNTDIPIQNIYFLLCYAWDKLDESDIVDVKAISTTEVIDLFAKILVNGTARLLKQGLDRYYVEQEYVVNGIKGKLDLSETVKRNVLPSHRTVCVYDDFGYDILHNQILKATIGKLKKVSNLDGKLRDKLRTLFLKLPPISEVNIRNSHFGQIRLHRNNYQYDLILKVCQIVNENLFIDRASGNYRFKDFVRDENAMRTLFQAFVRNFYNIEQSDFRVKGEDILWSFLSGSDANLQMLPKMSTDVSLISTSRKIIIETKFYKEIFRSRFGHKKIISAHLYQLFAYLKNQETSSEISQSCGGILLYAAVDKTFSYQYTYENHKISVVSINLNQDWQNIKDDLFQIISLE